MNIINYFNWFFLLKKFLELELFYKLKKRIISEIEGAHKNE